MNSEIKTNTVCPICLEELNDNNKLLRCKHFMHKKCFYDLLTNTKENEIMSCPYCKKSLLNHLYYKLRFNNLIEKNKVDEIYEKWISIIYCNDCNLKSNAKYHYKYHQCLNCKSYNTYVENIEKNS